MSANYTLAKDVRDYTISDIDIKGELYKVDNEDNILTLELECDIMKTKKHDLDNMPKIVESDIRDIGVIFSIWENILARLYYSMVNKQMNGYLLVHQDQDLWNGRSKLGISHINNYEITDDTITLWRYYTNTIDYKKSSVDKLVDISINENNCTESILTTLDGLPMIRRTFNSNVSISSVRTNDINFDVTLSANSEAVENIKNDPEFFKIRVPETGNKVQVLMKKPHSNDIDITISGKLTRTYKKDIYVDTNFIEENNGVLYDSVLENNNYKCIINNYNEYKGNLIDNGNLNIIEFSRVKKETINLDEYINSNFEIDHIDSKYGSLYVYFSNSEIFNKPMDELELYIHGNTKKYLRTDQINHCDESTLNKRIMYSTDYTYDYFNKIYTYKMEITEGNIDDGEITKFQVVPSEKQKHIKSVKVENGILIIESDIILCTYKSPNFNIKYTGTYSYIEYVDVYDDNYEFVFKINPGMIQGHDPDLYYIYNYDEKNKEKYKDYGSIDNKWISYNYKETGISDYRIINNLINKNISVESNKLIITIPKSQYETFENLYPLSNIAVRFEYEYMKPVLNKDVIFNEPTLFTAFFRSETSYICKQIVDPNSTDPYKDYYIYEFETDYTYIEENIVDVDSVVNYSLHETGYDIVYDVEYDNGIVNVYLFDEYKLYNYTDMRISFYLGEYDQLIQEIYETYKFTGKAKEKLEKIINYISFIKSGDIAYSFEKLKKDINAM